MMPLVSRHTVPLKVKIYDGLTIMDSDLIK